LPLAKVRLQDLLLPGQAARRAPVLEVPQARQRARAG